MKKCYNCNSKLELDFYLIVNEGGQTDKQFLYEDVCFDLKKEDELVEFKFCKTCLCAH